MPPPLPYATPDVPGIGGTIRERVEDFFVQELPLYEPSGEGEHVYCEVRKAGIGTMEMVDRVARALGVRSRDVGYAGLKDRRAVTQQLLSIPGVTEEAVMTTPIDGVTPRWAARHGNKLRLGHLAGNRFAIVVRGVNPADVVRVRGTLDRLAATGCPNYFGPQRFGRRDDNDLVGAALLRGDDAGVLKVLLGSPRPGDDYDEASARMAFEEGNTKEALGRWPGADRDGLRVLARYADTGDAVKAVRAIPPRMRKLYVSAFQSRLFNRVVADRLEGDGNLSTLKVGDLAMKSDNGACFRVEDAAAEQARAEAFEVSPTGPLFGPRMTAAGGGPGEAEARVLAGSGLTIDDFRRSRDGAPGARRAMRVPVTDTSLAAGIDDHGPHVTLAFTLPPGAYATAVLREVMKVEVSD